MLKVKRRKQDKCDKRKMPVRERGSFKKVAYYEHRAEIDAFIRLMRGQKEKNTRPSL